MKCDDFPKRPPRRLEVVWEEGAFRSKRAAAASSEPPRLARARPIYSDSESDEDPSRHVARGGWTPVHGKLTARAVHASSPGRLKLGSPRSKDPSTHAGGRIGGSDGGEKTTETEETASRDERQPGCARRSVLDDDDASGNVRRGGWEHPASEDENEDDADLGGYDSDLRDDLETYRALLSGRASSSKSASASWASKDRRASRPNSSGRGSRGARRSPMSIGRSTGGWTPTQLRKLEEMLEREEALSGGLSKLEETPKQEGERDEGRARLEERPVVSLRERFGGTRNRSAASTAWGATAEERRRCVHVQSTPSSGGGGNVTIDDVSGSVMSMMRRNEAFEEDDGEQRRPVPASSDEPRRRFDFDNGDDDGVEHEWRDVLNEFGGVRGLVEAMRRMQSMLTERTETGVRGGFPAWSPPQPASPSSGRFRVSGDRRERQQNRETARPSATGDSGKSPSVGSDRGDEDEGEGTFSFGGVCVDDEVDVSGGDFNDGLFGYPPTRDAEENAGDAARGELNHRAFSDCLFDEEERGDQRGGPEEEAEDCARSSDETSEGPNGVAAERRRVAELEMRIRELELELVMGIRGVRRRSRKLRTNAAVGIDHRSSGGGTVVHIDVTSLVHAARTAGKTVCSVGADVWKNMRILQDCTGYALCAVVSVMFGLGFTYLVLCMVDLTVEPDTFPGFIRAHAFTNAFLEGFRLLTTLTFSDHPVILPT